MKKIFVMVIATFLLAAGCNSQLGDTPTDSMDGNEAISDSSDNLAINEACTNFDRIDQPGEKYPTKEATVSSDGISSISTKGKIKTYKNSTYGFSFDFPCNWQLSGNREVGTNALNQKIVTVSLDLRSQATDCSANVYSGFSPVHQGPTAGPYTTVTEALINGKKFSKYEFKGPDGDQSQIWYTLNYPGGFYNISDGGFAFNQPCLEHIMKTFTISK